MPTRRRFRSDSDDDDDNNHNRNTNAKTKTSRRNKKDDDSDGNDNDNTMNTNNNDTLNDTNNPSQESTASTSSQKQQPNNNNISTELQDIIDNNDPDTLRIMISTDNHLGYNERDPVRGMDSFAAFEEVLYIAKQFHCDLILIAGDLFHDNRPSRRTIHKTMEIIRRYCMGSNPVQIQIISNQKDNFRSNPVTNVVNYQDPYYSIDLPIFSIHGNHDDPSRDAGGELLAALDLLAISNLVNYYGRQDQVDKVEISPILLQKGITKVALYGLGSMRDERLNRMWDSKKVRFLRPIEEDTASTTNKDNDSDNDNDEGSTTGFFNIFALHQNRDLGRGSKNCIQESMIPEWMDIVVWGHEHECIIDFFESVVGTFRITQPGSSVATSLVTGEATRKQVGILDINNKNFRLHPVPLTQVRSFVTTELSLRDHKSNLDPEDTKIDTKVSQLLIDEVNVLTLAAREKTSELVVDARLAGNFAMDNTSNIKYKLHKPDEVLVRIRVDHVGFTTLNNQRFGARFVGQVANANDILLFHRKKDQSTTGTNGKGGKSGTGTRKGSLTMLQPIEPEELERINVEDLIKEHLDDPDRKLKLLEEQVLCDAMEDYVEKSLVQAISERTISLLEKKQRKLIVGNRNNTDKNDNNDNTNNDSRFDDNGENDETTVNQSVADTTVDVDNKRKRRTTTVTFDDSDHDHDHDNNARRQDNGTGSQASASSRQQMATTSSRSRAPSKQQQVQLKNNDDFASDDDEMDVESPLQASKAKPKPKAKPTTSTARGRPKRTAVAEKKVNYKVANDSDDSEILSDDMNEKDVNQNDDDDDIQNDIDSVDEIDITPTQKRKGRATAVSRKVAPAMRQRSVAGTAKPKKKVTATPTTSQRSSTKGRSRYRGGSDDDDDDDFDDTNNKNRKSYDKDDINDDDDDDLDVNWGTANTKSQN